MAGVATQSSNSDVTASRPLESVARVTTPTKMFRDAVLTPGKMPEAGSLSQTIQTLALCVLLVSSH
jgi:hypothetical protein